MGRTLKRTFNSPAFARGGGVGFASGGLRNAPPSRDLGKPATVSVIVPTFNRQNRHEALYRCFQQQDYADRDMWVLDDSGDPSTFFCSLRNSDERVHYIHQPGRLSIGHKRNILIEHAAGDVIAHFDDDDDYKPGYLSAMLERLVTHHDADFAKLGRWNERREWNGNTWTYDGRSTSHANMWGYGFSYVYRRWVTSRVSFPHINSSEDYAFVEGLRRAGMKMELVYDCPHLVDHVLHGSNTSRRG